MLNLMDLNIYKEAFDGHKIIYIYISGMEFVFRTLSKKEYNVILNLCTEEIEIENSVCQMALVYPENYQFAHGKGLIPKTVSPEILYHSGFVDPSVVINKYNSEKDIVASSFEEQCKAIIALAYPKYSFEEMSEWSWDKLAKIASRAEFALNLVHSCNIKFVSQVNNEEQQTDGPIITIDEIANDIASNGGDPVLSLYGSLKDDVDFVEFPLIGGVHWDNEVIMNGIQQQISRSRLL